MNQAKAPVIAFYGFRGGKGGLSHVMLNLINCSKRLGVKAKVLIHGIPDELNRLYPGVEVVHLRDGNPIERIHSLYGFMKKTPPDILLSNREWGNWYSAISKDLSKAKTRLVFRVGNPMGITLKRRGPLKGTIRRVMIRWAYRSSSLVIANSLKVASDVHSITGIPLERIKVLKNPTFSEIIYEKAEPPPRHPWFSNSTIPIIMGMGRLCRQKDFKTLIQAFYLLNQELPSRLAVLGEGKERRYLEALVRDLGLSNSVDLLGHTENPFPYLKRASLFVLSSRWEGSPNCLIEAMALGVPVCATDCPTGPREILKEGLLGPLVPVGDPKKLKEAMKDVILSPQVPGERLIERAKDYDALKCTRLYLDTMKTILP